jgi:hypothetical protein
MTALDWAAKIVEEEGEALARSFLKAAEDGDWRAADALMNRIYGKPEQAVVAHVAASPAVEVIRSMSLDEKLELLGRLRAGEPATPELPILEAVPPQPSIGPPTSSSRMAGNSPKASCRPPRRVIGVQPKH